MSDQKDSDPKAGTDQPAVDPDSGKQDASETREQTGNSLAGDALAKAALKDPGAAEELRKHFQSTKDRGVQEAVKLSQETREFVEQLATQLGVSVEDVLNAERKIALNQIADERLGRAVSADSTQQPSSGQVIGSEARTLASSQLPKDLPEADREAILSDVAGRVFDDPAHLAQYVTQAALQKATTPKPDVSSTATKQGQQAAPEGEQEALKKQMDAEVEKATPAQAANIRRQYREKGLEV